MSKFVLNTVSHQAGDLHVGRVAGADGVADVEVAHAREDAGHRRAVLVHACGCKQRCVRETRGRVVGKQ